MPQPTQFASFTKIAITGRMGSGKTTVANLLAPHGFKRRSIAKKIREIVQDIGLPETREILQETGRFYRQWDGLVWVRIVARQAQEDAQKGLKTTVDDVRFMNEVTLLRSEGFLIVRLQVPSELRKDRIQRRDDIEIAEEVWKKWQDHPTEQEIDQIDPDIEIDNSYSLKELMRKIQDLIKNNRKK
ncbi:MAG: AAA family ATPase [Candidatus Hodarchaeota archaeon]